MVEYCKANGASSIEILLAYHLLTHVIVEGILMQCYAPNARNRHADNPVLQKIAQDTKRSPTQVLLRWSIQHG